jgi:glycosyltransferase involved in cell wall biosynthesis
MLFVSRPRSRPIIVVATFNGAAVLPRFVASARKLDPAPIVIVVDTGSSDYGFVRNARTLGDIFLEAPNTYDTGAYIHAANSLPDDAEIFFCHDSIEFKHPLVLQTFTRQLRQHNIGLVGWIGFPLTLWDTDSQKRFVKEACGIEDWRTEHGVFGPMFMAKAGFIKQIGRHLKKLPSRKLEQQAMERGWAIVAEHLGKRVVSLHFPNNILGSINNDEHADIKKKLLRRE